MTTETQSGMMFKLDQQENLSASEQNVIVADIGNSRIKLYDGDTFVSFKNGYNIDLNILNYISNRTQSYVVYSSVNNIAKNTFLQILKRIGCGFEDVEQKLARFSPIDFSDVPGMGNDRKLGLISALSIVDPPLITVDFGTCITVNLVDKNLKCLGGMIMPGFNTQARSLVHYTSSLPQVRIDFQLNPIGNDTVSAINAGIQNITFKGLDAHVKSLMSSQFAGEKVNVVMTGGISGILSQFTFSFDYYIDKHLVIEGIWSLASKNG